MAPIGAAINAGKPMHATGEAWINCPIGQALDPIINASADALCGRDLNGAVHAGALEALSAVLAGGQVFKDLSSRDVKRVAGAVASEAIYAGWR
jgi:hypothetical protein